MAGLVILGTRPEAIKLIPIIEKLVQKKIPVKIISTQQHPEAIRQIFSEHGIPVDFTLGKADHHGMEKQLGDYLTELASIVADHPFQFVIAQGDTLSAFSGMLFAYLNKTDFLFVESGLRTGDLVNPFPEEGLRSMMSRVARMNFAPTENERANLLKENIDEDRILVVGNTGIDYITDRVGNLEVEESRDTILLTVHRRENWPSLRDFFSRVALFAGENPQIRIIYPMHFNPAIQEIAVNVLSGVPNIQLFPPLSSQDFYSNLMRAALIITDSGGVQEEATFLNKKMIIIRDKTERLFLDEKTCRTSIDDPALFDLVGRMLLQKKEKNTFNLCYGDGKASGRIAEWIEKEYLR